MRLDAPRLAAQRRRWRGRLLRACLLLGLGLIQPLQAMAQDEVQERRSRIGVQLFRTMIASDLELATKIDPSSQLPLLVLYNTDKGAAESYAEQLRQSGRGEDKGRIREWNLSVAVSADADGLAKLATAPAAIYVVEPLSPEALKAVIDYGVRKRIVVFSSVEGDVEKGVLGGLHIGVRTLPYINTQTLEQSQLRLKDLFLKVAKPYG